MKTKIIQNIKAIILGLVLTLGMGYVAAQTFTGPTCSPTDVVGCNTPAPLNVGATLQSKAGPLATLGLGVVGDFNFIPTGLTPPTAGQVLMADNTNAATLSAGKVKWGTVASANVTPGSIVTCSKTVTSVFSGNPGIVGYTAADCGGYTVDSSYYGATKGVNATAGNGAQVAANFIPPFKTLNASEGGPAIQLFGQCSGPSGCFYNVSSVYIKLGGSGAATPAGLVVGGFGGIEGTWGVAIGSGCPAAYKTVYTGDSQQGNYQHNICLTK